MGLCRREALVAAHYLPMSRHEEEAGLLQCVCEICNGIGDKLMWAKALEDDVP